MSVDFNDDGERRGPDLMDTTPFEDEAIDAAIDAAGAQIESVGKMDILEWTTDDFRELVRQSVLAYTHRLRERCRYEAARWPVPDDEIPF